MSRAARFAGDEEGAALVEAALVLPVLLLVVFALTDLSLYFWQRGLAVKAADLAVRAAIVSDPVAEGPGLTPGESETYWFGRPPGAWCAAGGACPAFRVTCDLASGCGCPDGGCRFAFAARNLAPVLAAARAILPRLEPRNLRLTYATNGLGYVGRPPPVPVDVTLEIVGLGFEPIFAGLLFRETLPLHASATLPGEALGDRR